MNAAQEPTQLALCGLADQEPLGILEHSRASQSLAPSAAGSNNTPGRIALVLPHILIAYYWFAEHLAKDSYSSLDDTTDWDITPLSDNQFSDFLRDVMATPDTGTVGTNDEARWSNPDFRQWNVLDFNMDGDAELDWPRASLPWLDSLHPHHLPQQQPHLSEVHLVEEHLRKSGQPAPNRVIPKRQAGVGVEAFQKSSLSRWLPSQQDNTATHMNQLSVGAEEAEASYNRLSQEHRVLSEPLTATASNKVLAVILSTCDAEKGAAIAAAFPPRQLLDKLIQNYLIQNRIMSASFVHGPTFCANRERPELLGAVIAAGAGLSDSRSLQEFGLAIQEALSLVVQKRCEKSNTVTRELWLLQILMFEIEIALWSGSKRKMEIAESQTHVLFTVSQEPSPQP